MDYMDSIIHGDCERVLKEVPDNSIDLIFTSPPYARPAEENVRRNSS